MKKPAMKLNDILEIEPLSKALQRTLRLAHEHGTNELATWLQLELGGYYDSNSAMNTSITVPKYRTIVGAHFNIYGQRLQLPHDLSFVNEMRLREGVEALESLRDTRQTVVLQDPTMIGLIAQHLQVEVATFHFDSVELVQVLSQIRTELFSKAQVFADSLPKQMTAKSADCEEIVMLKPNIHGIGVDLRALWRKATRGKS
jgi:AbiTii